MSRKLLMCNGKKIGYVYDRTLTADYAEGIVDFGSEEITPIYSYGYLLEAFGKSSYPGSTDKFPTYNFHKVALYDTEKNKYKYTIESKSADGTKVKTVSFYLDHLLDEIDRTTADIDPGLFTDRLYWDENYGEYMLEIQTAHKVYEDSDGWIIDTGNGNIINIDLDTGICLYPNGASTSKPCIKSNYYVVEWTNRIAMNGPWNQRTLSWIDENTLCYGHMLGDYPTKATKEQLDALFIPEMHIVYAIEKQLVRTGIKKKIKIPLFGEGTTFALKNYDDVFTGTEVTGEQITYGSIKIEVPCTDAVVYEPFEGESITPSFSSDTHVFCEDEPIYLEEVNGVHYYARIPDGVTTATYNVHVMRTLGTPLDNGKYEYTVTATSADGTKTKDIKFAMDYQLLNYVTPNKMYWNDELGCYDVLMYTGYEYITNVDDFGTLKYGDYTIFTKETDDGKVAYGGGNSDGVLANGTFHQAGRNSIYAYTHTITNGSTSNGYTIGLCIHDVHTAEEFNATIAENGPIQVFYQHNTEKIYHTDIKKKIELPWFGEGTTYTLKNGDLSSTFKIGLPTKYEHKIAYKEYTSLEMYGRTNMTTTIQPTIKDLDVYDICYSYESYIDTIINPVDLYDGGGYDVAIDNGNGTYSYNIEGSSRTINPDTGGAIVTSLFTQEIKLPYRIDGWFQNTTYNGRDRFYWDDTAGQYMLEKNSMRIVIDSAYGDVEFKPFSYSSYSLNKGNCWEFALPDGCDAELINVSYSSQCMLNTNYQLSDMTSAYIYDDDGVIFHPDYHSTFEGDKSLVFHYQYATTLDLLDQQLKTKPLILILPIPEPITIATGIKKKIKLPLTQSMCEAGVQVTMKNTNSAGTIINGAESLTNGIITIKVPVEYKTIEVPEPTYQLPAKTVLSGSSSGGFINTGVKLFDTAKDSTVIIDFQNVNANGSFTPENGDIVFHCRYESSSYKYRGFSLVYENTYNSWRMMGNTTYNNGNLGDYEYASIDNSSRESYCWRYRYAFIFKAGILNRAINLSAESISSIDTPAPAVFYDEGLYAQKAAFGNYTGTAYIGRKGSSSTNYYQGTIHDCKIWDGVALTDAQIQALYCGPYPRANYESGFYEKLGANPLYTNQKLFEDAKCNFSILLDFTHKDIGTATTTVLSCGIYGDNICRLCVEYNNQVGGYRIAGGSGNYTRDAVNFLANNAALPSVNGRYTIFIIYKNGVINRVVDCSTGVPIDLQLIDNPTSATAPYAITLGYMSYSENDTATNRDTCQVWLGQLNNCIIWKDKVLNDSEIDYLIKYGCN